MQAGSKSMVLVLLPGWVSHRSPGLSLAERARKWNRLPCPQLVVSLSLVSMTIRVWLFLVAILMTRGAESPDGLKDLGVLSPNTMIPLLRNTERTDFSHFEVEVAPSLNTNHVVKFTTTNEFLDLSHLTALPSGRMLLGLKAVSTSGVESAVSIYVFTIWRSEKLPSPAAGTVMRHPRARTNRIGEGPDSLLRAFGRLRASSTQRGVKAPPPLPSGLTNFPGALPSGRPETYADHLDAEAERQMRQFYAKTGRRNE